MGVEEAVVMLQRHERARQGRLRAKLMLEIRRQENAEKNKGMMEIMSSPIRNSDSILNMLLCSNLGSLNLYVYHIQGKRSKPCQLQWLQPKFRIYGRELSREDKSRSKGKKNLHLLEW